MKELFSVGLKLLGVLVIVGALQSVLLSFQGAYGASALYYIGLIAILIVQLGIAILLVSNTESIANALNIPDTPVTSLNVSQVLRIGITLIGVYLVGSSLCYALTILFYNSSMTGVFSQSAIITEVLRTILGILMIAFAKPLTNSLINLQDRVPKLRPYSIDEN